MNLIEFIKKFTNYNIIFTINGDYKQVENELYYIKNNNIYKTNINNPDFSGNSNMFVWSINMILHGSTIMFNHYKDIIINEKRTIKTILNYGYRLKE